MILLGRCGTDPARTEPVKLVQLDSYSS